MEQSALGADSVRRGGHDRPTRAGASTERDGHESRSSQGGERDSDADRKVETKRDHDEEEEKTIKRQRRGGDSETETLTHAELSELTSSTLGALLRGDTVMSDLPSDVTVEEVTAQIALAQGQSMTVTVAREDGVDLNVVVAQGGNVLDLKRAVQRHVTLKLRREGRSHVKVNWRYVWRNNWLSLADGTKLTSEAARLADVGVRNKSRVKFAKRLDERHRIQ